MTPDAREQARHKASVMIAFAEGKEIQARPKQGRSDWSDLTVFTPSWDWAICEYRVKPEERKPREVKMWVNPNLPECIYPETWTMADATGWTLVPFVEVLPSENTGGQSS